MSKTKQPRLRSLRTDLLATILICWVLPIFILATAAGILLNASFERSVRQTLETEAESSLEQLELRMNTAFEASKSVSYDGVVRNAYRSWQLNGDSAALYRTVTEYLTQAFSRDASVKSVFLSFWDDTMDVHPYFTERQNRAGSVISAYRRGAEPVILEAMAEADTAILLLEYDGELYLVRNLLDSRFEAYATVVMLCDEEYLFQSLDSVWALGGQTLVIDETLALDRDLNLTVLSGEEEEPSSDLNFTGDVSGHTLRLEAEIQAFNVWRDMPGLRTAVLAASLLVLPLLAVMIYFFRRLVTRPMERLVDASARVQGGERGYVIEESAESREFQKLYRHFNSMSTELQNQFERSYREQQALQQAKMKALQSQINPHFLNNTLEIINWEARMAEDNRVSAMIEALSTMLNGALDRDGRSRIPLREELSYADAYLYIIRERLGDKLVTEKEVDEDLLDILVPRLILQPLAENAVEHDITPRRGGKLFLRAYRRDSEAVLEVEHDGTLSPSDREELAKLLSAPDEPDGTGSRVGLRNVRERLRLLYGDAASLTVEQTGEERVLARVVFPLEQHVNCLSK